MSRSLAVVILALLCGSCGGGSAAPSATPAPAAACAITVPPSVSVLANAGASGISVTAAAGCSWNVSTGATFITVTSGTSGAGTGVVTFTVTANTGAARAGVITIGGQAVTVNQAATANPASALTFAPPNPPPGIVGVPYNFSIGNATGGVQPIHYQLQTAGGFPPIGLLLGPDGTISGTPTIEGTSPVSLCAVDATGASICRPLTIAVTEDPVLGEWAGTTHLTAGCAGNVGLTNEWTGTVRRTAGKTAEIVINSPGLAINNEVVPVSLNGTTIAFSSALPAPVSFVATLAANRMSIAGGTFSGPAISPACAPSAGTWTGARK